jgi:hypothetical protein
MKKSLFAGMLATALVFGLALSGCDDPTKDDGGGGGGGSGDIVLPSTDGLLTVTGLSAYNGKYIAVGSESGGAGPVLSGVAGINRTTKVMELFPISGGQAEIKIYETVGSDTVKGYSGSDTVSMTALVSTARTVVISDSGGLPAEVIATGTAQVSFVNGKANEAFTFIDDARAVLAAGPPVGVAAAATTAMVAFTGATGVALANTDFAVSAGGAIANVNVTSDTATVTVTFAANASTTAKTYTVSIAGTSSKIKGNAAVAITQAAFVVSINPFVGTWYGAVVAGGPGTPVICIITETTIAYVVPAYPQSNNQAAYTREGNAAVFSAPDGTSGSASVVGDTLSLYFTGGPYAGGVGTFTRVSDGGLTSALIADPATLLGYINATCSGGTAQAPKTMKFSGAITEANLNTVRGALYSVGTYVIWDLSAATGLSAADIGDAIHLNNGGNSFSYPQPGSDKIKGLVLPSGLSTIGEAAFILCSDLTSVTLPSGLTSIDGRAFDSCTGLASITLPASLTDIDGWAFSGCRNLTFITGGGAWTAAANGKMLIKNGNTVVAYPAASGAVDLSSMPGLTVIGDNAFAGCTGLASITLPAGLASIGFGAFQNCTGLAGVTIPAGVASIGDYAFAGCTGLASIAVDAANTAFSSEDGVLFNKTKTTLLLYPTRHSGTSYSIPASVARIEDSAFAGCTSLESVTMPASVDSIGLGAFARCTGLASVTIPASVASIGDYAFALCSSLTSVTFGTGSNIASGNFGSYVFPPNYSDALKTLYLGQSTKAGTYRRASTSASEWTKD